MIIPIILAGGVGTRLWPLSREQSPKQLLPLISDKSMLLDTLQRLDGLSGVIEPIVICNDEHRFVVAEQLRNAHIQHNGIVLEPVGRNTAPAVAIGALHALNVSEDAVLLVLPADHVIKRIDKFHQAVDQGYEAANEGRLVTFGIEPARAETGYGYIKKGQQSHTKKWVDVDAFVEKPDAVNAKKYYESGEYLWNSGMFMFKANTYLEELEKYEPEIVRLCKAAVSAESDDLDFVRIASSEFVECPSISIDYAVMEKTKRSAVLPLDCEWSDVGSWDALWDVLDKDHNGNVLHGDVYSYAVSDSLIHAEHRTVAVLGVKDVIVVETADAVLVTNKAYAQDVKKIVDMLKRNNDSEKVTTHLKVLRPWGAYECLDVDERFKVKRITVAPGKKLSMQLHHHRAEPAKNQLPRPSFVQLTCGQVCTGLQAMG